MPRQNYVIYCDESAEKGKFYSHFYGGALIEEKRRVAINEILNEEKRRNNLFGELKWTKITENYEEKYINFLNRFFDLIDEDLIKIRIMFTQNRYNPKGLTDYQIDNQYFLLYYQLIKHAFGLRYCNPERLDDVYVRLYLDDVPDTQKKFSDFKDYLHSLCHFPVFRRANVMIPREDITDVKSHDHVIMQGLDLVLGSMQFRLNDMHRVIPKGQKRRGKRTRSKERVFKHISRRIRGIQPGFNIGMSTGTPNGQIDRWHQPYRHWLFIPSDHEVDHTRSKRKKK